jgi:ComF family protein
MKKLFNELMDFVLPRFCPSCSKKLLADEKCVCSGCLDLIQVASPERLQKEYDRKFSKEKIITDFFSLFVFEKDKALQDIIHSFKYNRRFQNAAYLGELLGFALDNYLRQWRINYIIPVPLHRVKKAERGYNQSYYISKGIERSTSFPVNNSILKRSRFTESQTTMTLAERKQNINDAFSIRTNKRIIGKNILMLDDVITTGATVAECGRILLEHGAGKVYAASVAIAD